MVPTALPLRARRRALGHLTPISDVGYDVTSFNPTRPATIMATKASRNGSADSPNRTIPSSTVPTVPTPVQTAYAVPTGRVRTARPSSVRLNTIAATVTRLGTSRVNPSVYLRPIAQP